MLPQTVADIQRLGDNPYVNFPETNYTELVNSIAQEQNLRVQARGARVDSLVLPAASSWRLFKVKLLWVAGILAALIACFGTSYMEYTRRHEYEPAQGAADGMWSETDREG